MTTGFSKAAPLVMIPPSSESGILVVDEDPAFQLGLKTFLKEYVGFEHVYTARNGKEALEVIRQEDHIDLITLDYQMPVMDGLEFLERLDNESHRTLSVIMITGCPDRDLEDRFRQHASADLLTPHFLQKPLDFEGLEPLILRAHHDLMTARTAVEEPEAPSNLPPEPTQEAPREEAHRQEDLVQSLSQQDAKLDELAKQITKLRRRSRFHTLFLALLILAVGAAIHFKWFSHIEPLWEQTQTRISNFSEQFSQKADNNGLPTKQGNPSPALFPKDSDEPPPPRF